MDTATLAKLKWISTLATVLSLVASVSFAQRIPCGTVLRELQRVERYGAMHGGDPGRVAKTLGTSSAWVEKCATVYGRRLQSDDSARHRAELQERVWEEQEPEEFGREERETEDDVVVDPAPYRDKSRQRGFSLSKEEWEPYERRPWSPNSGKQWSPYLVDPHRTTPDDVEGLVRD